MINRSNFSFVRLLDILQQYCSNKEFDRECNQNRESRKSQTNHGSTLVNSVHSLLTPFAFKKFAIQYQQEGFYKVVSTPDGWLVQRNEQVVESLVDARFEHLGNNDIDEGLDDSESSATNWFVSSTGQCHCQYMTSMGITCRHTIAVSTLLFKQGLTSDRSGILGGVAIPYWFATSAVATSNFQKPQSVVASSVSIACQIIVILYIICSILFKTSPLLPFT